MRAFLKAVGRGVASGGVLAIAIAAAAAAAPAAHALKGSTFFFRAQDGTILTLLMLEFLAFEPGAGPVPGGGTPACVGVASLAETDRRGEELPGALARAVPLELSSGPAAAGKATFFGRVYLQSGRSYTLRYMVNDDARDAIFLKYALVAVPYLGGGFSASSVVPAERYGPAEVTAVPFQVGSEEVIPKAGGVFRRNEKLRLYLQAYDAAIDAVTSRSRVDLAFRFYRVVKGASKRHGKPFTVRAAAGPSMGLEISIDDWPTGSYRVVVELHDRVSQARTSTEGSFSIADD